MRVSTSPHILLAAAPLLRRRDRPRAAQADPAAAPSAQRPAAATSTGGSARRATTRCRSSASRSTAPTSSISIGSIPDAPKGGTLRGFAEGSFDSLNPFTVKGVPAASLGLIYDSLLAPSPDEPSAEYGLIAEWVSYPDDYSSVTFGIDPKARFHDGTPITPEDVIF